MSEEEFLLGWASPSKSPEEYERIYQEMKDEENRRNLSTPIPSLVSSLTRDHEGTIAFDFNLLYRNGCAWAVTLPSGVKLTLNQLPENDRIDASRSLVLASVFTPKDKQRGGLCRGALQLLAQVADSTDTDIYLDIWPNGCYGRDTVPEKQPEAHKVLSQALLRVLSEVGFHEDPDIERHGLYCYASSGEHWRAQVRLANGRIPTISPRRVYKEGEELPF